ncbi:MULTISPECIES: hypothetical protein [Cryobacterium]|uniref:SRPBCC family protein n=1 Tax=Cryobacterium glucosi TaxID=1259175 RepID=A0ABY2ISK1_9MICO|nr:MULTISPECIES: hypothetical protein [Cryobacterium]TFB92227.1 hypothetical protein E3O39_17740 [Cryobacterium sp. MDB2-A-1]TFC01805.1 hypothetical protein E3O59_19365 [Cryobacterium sp. MDB2-33-2]TFC10340.1 hypothetical protein E3O35_13415 [Cryobacterium sp. MDB2-A-2]TFC12399.1 hypothetical protein E3O51_18545 [Cryobacterium sp. MDB2-10]TFC23452.1 hypothetical protein E3O55_17500 [Cryobacterium sp. MDB1-18-2]
MDAISILADWDHHPRIRSTLRTTRLGASTLSSIDATPVDDEWTVTRPDDDVVERRTADGVYTLTIGHKEVERFFRDARRVPPALCLVFPMSAFIWGRPRDMWRMVGAAREGDETKITLVHTEQTPFEAILTVNHDLRIATKLASLGETLEMFDFE